MSLFDKEEIHQDLILMVAESQDESKLVVYGEMYVLLDKFPDYYFNLQFFQVHFAIHVDT